MQHIVRKPLREWDLNPETVSALDEFAESQQKVAAPASEAEKRVAYMQTANGKMIQAFPYVNDGRLYHFVEPHPVTLYFNIAQFFIKHIEQWKSNIFIEADKPQSETSADKQLDALYTFFSNFSMFATSLYNALESFANYAIPNDFKFIIEGKKSTEIFDKNQIQRHFPTDRKLWEVLPSALGRHFDEKRLKALKAIFNTLKECRDEIMHTKHGGENYPNEYKKIFTSALDLDYNAVLEATAEIINFYEPNLIQECMCGKTH